ncbi:ABC transporter substrate-binding protein [Laedolimicola ammoniilytica]|uniref:Extracellular solute-binding protein n=1 Tax=Laedolimicola ammoniilytica TaxID=2981771 RepID=A0ABT2RVL3_9FIRM|nr:ABC transporter substrate-binding protein [Laedolimicola ammoniilytica]MCU6696353.1 extracellular solute-binding protein [Laedolimicola ammoniilytica]SCH60360.1 Maltose-binding periplasmic proteins/domains [uncultured Clostridium sp.]
MNKKLLALTLSGALAVSMLAGCGGSSNGGDTSTSTDTKADTTEASGAEGSVYYLNFKPEQDQQWQDLAKAYTDETGVPVTVVTAASGNYETTLMSEMGKSGAPTLFQVNGPVGLANWKDYCYDLAGSDIYGQLTSDNYALKEDDTVYGIAYVIESYGLIVNKTLLEKAGYTIDDIQSFADLKKVAEDITARSSELGFAAFTSAGMDGSSDWRFKTHLANLPIYFEYQTDGISSTDAIKGTYLDNYRDMWDLYINNSTCDPKELSAKTGDDSRNEFLAGDAVFFQNGSWEYANLTGDGGYTDDDLAMIPIYIGAGDEANQGLCTGTENYWCVNNQADEADIKATLDFMNWCVTSELGTKTMAEDMGFVIPFKGAQESKNLFVKQDAEYTAEGKTPVSWNFTTMPSEEWKNGVGQALTAYAADQTDANWAGVVSAFVDGWATEYQMANGQ